jgi:hypothetical protein
MRRVYVKSSYILPRRQAQDGATKIPVGQVIAVLAEQGDDLSSITIPSNLSPEGTSSAPSSEPSSTPTESYKEETMSIKPGPESKQVQADGKTASQAGVSQEVVGDKHGVVHSAGGKPLFPSVMRMYVCRFLRLSLRTPKAFTVGRASLMSCPFHPAPSHTASANPTFLKRKSTRSREQVVTAC